MQVDLTDKLPALLILDLQELFTSAEGPFNNTGANELINSVNSFVSDCAVINIPIIYSRYLLRDDLGDAGLLADHPVVKEGHFCQSSPSMQLDHRLRQTEPSINLHRNRPGAFWGGMLEQTLAAHDINALLLCGLSVNNAISTTAREAFARDIPVIVVKECTGAAPWETELEIYFDILNTWTAEVLTMRETLTRLENTKHS